MARETWVQSQVESYQRLKKWYLMPPCLALSIIRYGSRVKWSNPGKGVAPSPTPWCSKLSKRGPSGHPRLWSPTLLTYIYMVIFFKDSVCCLLYSSMYKLDFDNRKLFWSNDLSKNFLIKWFLWKKSWRRNGGHSLLITLILFIE